MNQDTPARLIKPKDLAENSQAMGQLIAKVPREDVKTVLDIRYGLGGWSKQVRQRFPDCFIEGWEQDEETSCSAWKDSSVSLKSSRWHPNQGCYDLLLADFNIVTVLNRELLDEALAGISCKWLVFTDVACFRLHLNYRYYGLSLPDLEAYWQAFKVSGYSYVAYARTHHAASTALYKQKPRRVGPGFRSSKQ